MKKILIIEDDPAISLGLEDTLSAEHYEVLVESDGELGFQKALKGNIDIIILDLMLPSKNGLEICRDLRSRGINTRILMLTSKKDEVDKVLGLEIGADDYMTKPFSVRELKARINVMLRRMSIKDQGADQISFNDIKIDFKKLEATKKNKELKLSAAEFKILKYLIRYEGEVISRDQFLDDVWGYDSYPTTRTVDNYILSIRKQIEEDPSNPKHLLTIHKAGYKFVF